MTYELKDIVIYQDPDGNVLREGRIVAFGERRFVKIETPDPRGSYYYCAQQDRATWFPISCVIEKVVQRS
jgi:hypothetical protein